MHPLSEMVEILENIIREQRKNLKIALLNQVIDKYIYSN